ncbi:MAG: hypothetical protein SGPRY_009984 [Prymnesium sp.]
MHMSSRAPHKPDPSSNNYVELVEVARLVQRDKTVVVAAADFDYRQLAMNWHASAKRHYLPAIVLALDTPAYEFFRTRKVPVANLTSCMVSWRSTRLQRHIQRAVMERLVAATALTLAGFDVLLADATSVFVADPLPFFRAERKDVALFLQRDSYPDPKLAIASHA